MSNGREGGMWALAGYLYQIVGMLSITARISSLPLKPGATGIWSVVPPAMFGPPELCFLDKIESVLPGAIQYAYGQGKSTYVPWNLDLLFEANAMPGHEKAFQGLVLDLLPDGSQIETNAHPAVEINLFEHPGGDFVLTLVNSSGYMPPAVREPISMTDIEIKVKLPKRVSKARSIVVGEALPVREDEGRTHIMLPGLGLFETIVFEPAD